MTVQHTAGRRRIDIASESTSAPDVLHVDDFVEHDQQSTSFVQGKKRKIAAQEPVHASKTYFHEPPHFLYEDSPAIDETELQLLSIESCRLEFEVKRWKQQQALRREKLQLKSEEITLKEATTKEKQKTQMMELRSKLFNALDEAGKGAEEADEYFALLQG